jgi:MoaA/NifB/PqqE/SkfB family radical SAM enzyme
MNGLFSARRSVNKTLCPRLWDEIFIDSKGDVFSCCHKKHRPAGNISKGHLRDICNGRVMRGLRKESLSGRLACYKGCTLLRKEKDIDGEAKGTQVDYRGLKRLKIAFGDACNIHCLMCRRTPGAALSLDFEALKEKIDLSPFESIELQGGEPLFIESARRFFDHASSLGKKVSFLTNGTLIDDVWARKIAAHSLFVNFSLNAASKTTHELVNRGSRWETVLANVAKVRAAREASGNPLMIIGHMTIVMENLEEIPLFITSCRGLGFDRINFGYDRRVPLYLKLHPFKAESLASRISEAMEGCAEQGRVDVFRLRLLGLYTDRASASGAEKKI